MINFNTCAIVFSIQLYVLVAVMQWVDHVTLQVAVHAIQAGLDPTVTSAYHRTHAVCTSQSVEQPHVFTNKVHID